MAAISQTVFSDAISWMIFLYFDPKGLIDDMFALIQVKPWRLTGDKPLPEPMMTQFTNAYLLH